MNKNIENEYILKIKDLKTYFNVGRYIGRAVDGISFSVKKGEILGVVGESGSGKSVTALSIMRLLKNTGKVVNGQINFNGKDLLDIPEKEMRKIRGNKISMIFQEPMTSLNPVLTIGDQIGEIISEHTDLSKVKIKERIIELLKMVSIPNPEDRLSDYPHQFSGGMRQRVIIAIALACEPELLIADEPTTALDVTIQAQILDLLMKLKEKLNKTAIMLITHNLGVVAETCDFVLVMYAGQVVENGLVKDIFENPKHPYTKGLIGSVPIIGKRKRRLIMIDGSVPSVFDVSKGCKFYSRCKYRKPKCEDNIPELIKISNNHYSRCFFDIDKLEKV